MKNQLIRVISSRAAPAAALALIVTVAAVHVPPVPPELLSGLVWRNVGPFRGGRITATSGAIDEVGTFYVGTAGGGVWKTTSAGETWFPILDSVTTVSAIGALEVAPSNTNIIYIGAGQLFSNEGDGVYKSVDAGRSWRHLGLDATRRISSIIVDPRNADFVLVGALGSPTKSESRGVFRSADGGTTWYKTLFVSDSTGVSKLASAFDRPDVVFATTFRTGSPPVPLSGVRAPAVRQAPDAPTGAGVFKSTDGGVTWTELSGGGLPRFRGVTSIAVAMNTNAQRVYLITDDGLYRSDDGGTTWRQMDASDERIRSGQGGYNCGVLVDPKDPDLVYTFNTASYKSTDGGASFTGFKGAPGGDDPQVGWIDPTNARRMLLGYDQGAIVSLDHGATWSSWYNQSTEQVYHVSTDNSFPYWIYATQQDAGAIRTRSRGNLGAITPLDWSPVSGWEWGTIVPDPLDPNTVYATGIDLLKIHMPTGQRISVSPGANPELHLRSSLSQPLVWAPWDQRELLAGFHLVMATTDGGAHWRTLSPDLTYPAGVTPPADTAAPLPNTPRRGSIETIAASPIAKGTIWVGTTNGLIKLTKDHGKTWIDATIPNLPYAPIALIEKIEAAPFDAGGAYAAVNVQRARDDAPYLYRTHDYGKSWQRITTGLAADQATGGSVRVVRADPKRAGLLFAGTESGMSVSFDDGDHWQSLQLNLPNTSYRDIAFAGNDLVVGTYGRGIWILDDFAVLRQMTPEVARDPAHLFKPDPAVRVRRNTGYNTPFPPEVPHALNPPDGAIIYYWLASKPSGEITLDVMDSTGAPVRHLSSVAVAPVKEAARPPEPNFWLAEPQRLPATPGTNRTNWDLQYDPPPAFSHSFEINANPGRTPVSPEGALAPPGTYTIRLTVEGKSYDRTVVVTNDPRSPATLADVRVQGALVRKIDATIRLAWTGYQQLATMRAALEALKPADSTSDVAHAIASFHGTLDSLGGIASDQRPFIFGDRGRLPSDFFSLHGRLQDQFTAQESGDLAPTEAMLHGFALICQRLTSTAARWQAVNASEVRSLNAKLVTAGQRPLTVAPGLPAPKC